MSNPLHPSASAEIGGRVYPLRYEYRDLVRAEGRLNIPLVGPGAQAFWSAPDGYKTAVLLFVGMAHKMPATWTLDDAMGLIDFENAGEIQRQVLEAFEKFMPKPKDGGEKEPDPLAGTTVPATSGTEATPSADAPSA